ncbi:hypothetical protein HaLaN_24312 [Haematococcus lacustris]|uniref:Uncharacterized protein n=1 Tax=Haematococcus lacustris TaxID=44745 RepID=A0A699ZW66_HAELA|nr:hypothetical protein HaLaN_24312 [Haematococcus lacustris]
MHTWRMYWLCCAGGLVRVLVGCPAAGSGLLPADTMLAGRCPIWAPAAWDHPMPTWSSLNRMMACATGMLMAADGTDAFEFHSIPHSALEPGQGPWAALGLKWLSHHNITLALLCGSGTLHNAPTLLLPQRPASAAALHHNHHHNISIANMRCQHWQPEATPTCPSTSSPLPLPSTPSWAHGSRAGCLPAMSATLRHAALAPNGLDHANPPKPTASSQGPMAAQNPSQAAQDGRGGNLATPPPPPLMLANPEEIELGDFDDADSGLTTQPTEGGGAASSAGRGVEKMMAANPEEIDLEDDAEGSQGGDEPAALVKGQGVPVEQGARDHTDVAMHAEDPMFQPMRLK